MNIFEKIRVSRPKRNTFDLSHEVKMSGGMGTLYPMLTQEVVPGDTFQVNSEVMLRLAPMIAPVMHRVDVYCHYFFVPTRIIWDEFQQFITQSIHGYDYPAELPEWPHFSVGTSERTHFQKGRLGDYLGIPPMPAVLNDPILISSLPFRAYRKIFNDYYRDQDIEYASIEDHGSGLDNSQILLLTNLQLRCWEKDYFTSARPYAQKGGEVAMPFDPEYTKPAYIDRIPGSGAGALTVDANDNLLANGVNATIHNIDGAGITINDLRTATRLQRWLERNARGGSRYIEQILSHFGVKSSDGRLQRPEYLGGGKQPVVISEVLNTTGDAGGTEVLPQGNMSGHGISVGKTNSFRRYFEEHGYVMGIISVIPKTAYSQGISKMFKRQDFTDYYWPEFAHLGEQQIERGELYLSGTDSIDRQVFGYTPKYAEYKYNPDRIAGDFRDTLEFWHLGRDFVSNPALNTSFVKCVPSERIFADTSGTDKLFMQIYHKIKAKRPMPFFATPTL